MLGVGCVGVWGLARRGNEGARLASMSTFTWDATNPESQRTAGRTPSSSNSVTCSTRKARRRGVGGPGGPGGREGNTKSALHSMGGVWAGAALGARAGGDCHDWMSRGTVWCAISGASGRP